MAGRTPPKTKTKLSAKAQAELGATRVCVECEDEKIVSHQTFAPDNKGTRGWADVCRVCQGVASAEKAAPKRTKKRPSSLRAKFNATQKLITDLYFLPDGSERDAVIEDLTNALRELPDRESFELFVRICEPLVAGWQTPGAIHDDIKDGLLSEADKVLIIATRYSAKSTLTAMYVTWRIFRNELIKILVVSRGSTLAKRMLRTVRWVFIENCPLLKHLVPTEECLDNAEQFQTPASLQVTTGGATFTSMGITSNIVGLRADLTVLDDVEGPQEDTPEKVQELREKLNEIHMINPKGEKITLGTYQSEFSVYALLAEETDEEGTPIWENHRACMFEEDVDPQTNKKTYRSRWPAMFSDYDALQWRRSVTERAWRLHAMLIADPSILNERPLKISDFILLEHDAKAPWFPLTVEPGGGKAPNTPTWSAPKGDVWYAARTVSNERAQYALTVMAVDPASGLAGRDAIGVAVISVTPSGLGVVRHLEGVRSASKAENMRRVAVIARDYACSVIVVEETKEGFFGETLENELIMVGMPSAVEKVTTGGQMKGRRIIEALAPPMGASRLIMLDSVARSDHGGEFVNQLVRISYDGRTGKAKDHDDIVDALAHAVARVKGSLIGDIASNVGEHRAAQLEHYRELPLRQGGLGGFSPNRQNRRGFVGEPVPDGGLSMAERLLEEDRLVIRMRERRDRIQEHIQRDMAMGRKVDPYMVETVKALTHQLKELEQMQVL